MTLPTFVDLVEPMAVPAPAFARLTADELHMDAASYQRHVDLEDKIEAGTATIEDRAEAALRTFVFCNVADMRLVEQGEVYGDGKHHYFRSSDLAEHLFQEVPEIIDKWTVRYEQAMLRKLNCHPVKMDVTGSRGRAKSMHVHRTAWRGGMEGLTLGSPAGAGCYWSFDPNAPWNAGMSDHEILSLEHARTEHATMWLTDEQMADARANPRGIPVALEKPKDAQPIKALPAMLTPEEEARVAMSDDDGPARRRRKGRTPAMERNRKKGLRRHFAMKAEEDAGERLDGDFVIPT